VIVDGIFKKSSHIEQIIQAGKEKNTPVIIYQLECSLETLKKRDREREGVAQGLWEPLGDDLVESLWRKVEENPIEGAIIVNTEQTSLQECLDIIKKNFES
jgi:tRNA uridine 5-carbamoylmethylation protein Kti12